MASSATTPHERPKSSQMPGQLLRVLVAAQLCSGALGFLGPASLPPQLRACRATFGACASRPAELRPMRKCARASSPTMLLGYASPVSEALTTLPVLAVKAACAGATAVSAAARTNPLLVDALFAGVLYVLGKVTSGAILNKKQSPEGLRKWFVCGLVDGWACHAWYSLMELKFAFITDRLQKTIAMNGVSTVLFTPAYCAGFLVLLSVLEKKGLRGAVSRVQRDWKGLARTSAGVWAAFNVPLFLWVPLSMRVMASMGFHYVYLVGLALWDANARAAAKAGAMAEPEGAEEGVPMVTVPMVTEPTPQPALQLSGDVSYLQDLMAGVPDLASEGSPVALPVAHAVAPEFESQDTAWGSGLEESSFAGASTQSGLKMSVAKVPNFDVDAPTSAGHMETSSIDA